MLKRMEQLMRGSVTFRVTSPYPERVLNVCAAQNIGFWDLRRHDETTLSLTVRRAERRRLRAALRALDVQVELERAAGAPYFAARFRRRYALLAGLSLVAALLVVNSLFIRDFEVSGNETVRTEIILRALDEVGVRRGTFALSFRPKDVCNRVLPKVPGLSWLTVNVRGSCAYVSVRERVPKPEIVNERVPTNVVARRAALVTEVRPLDGEAKVMKGTTVFPGQLLISGVEDLATAGARILPSLGQVWARTWRELQTEMPLTVTKKVYTGEVERKYSVIFGTKRIKFYGNGGEDGVYYDKIRRSMRLTLPGDIALPVTVVTEEWRAWTPQQVTVTPTQAEEAARTLLLRARELLLGCQCVDGCPGCVGAAAGRGAKFTLIQILNRLLEPAK